MTVRKCGSTGSGTIIDNSRKLLFLLPRVWIPYIQHRSRQVSSLQVSTAQVGMGQVAAAQICHLEVDVAKIQAGKVGPTEIQTLKKAVNTPRTVTQGKGEVWAQKNSKEHGWVVVYLNLY